MFKTTVPVFHTSSSSVVIFGGEESLNSATCFRHRSSFCFSMASAIRSCSFFSRRIPSRTAISVFNLDAGSILHHLPFDPVSSSCSTKSCALYTWQIYLSHHPKQSWHNIQTLYLTSCRMYSLYGFQSVCLVYIIADTEELGLPLPFVLNTSPQTGQRLG